MSRSTTRRRRYSIRFKVVVPLALAGLIFTAYTYLLASQYMHNWTEDEMAERATRLHATLESASRQGKSEPDLQAVTLAQGADEDVELIVVVDGDSQQVVASTNSWNNLNLSAIPDPEVRAEIESSLNGGTQSEADDDELAYLYVEPIRTAGLSASDVEQFAVIQLDGSDVQRDARIVVWSATGAVGLISLFVVGLVYSQVTRHVLVPIETLEEALRRPGASISTEGIKKRRDELGSLARAVGDTLDRLSGTARPAATQAFDTSVTFARDGRIVDATVTDDQDVLSPNAHMVETNIDRHLPPDVCELLLEEFDALHQTGEMLQFEFEHYAYGMRSVYEARARANTGGQSVTVVIRDATDQKQLSEQVDLVRQQTRDLLAALPVTIIGLDLHGEIQFTNHMPFGAPTEGTAEGENLLVYVPENQRSVVEDAIEDAITRGTARQFQLRLGTAEEPRFWLNELVPLSIDDDAGELLLVSIDLTSQRGVEERLHAQVERLRAEVEALTERQEERDAAVTQLREEMESAAVARDEALHELRETQERLRAVGGQLAEQLSSLAATVAALHRVAPDRRTRSFAESIQDNVDRLVGTFSSVVPIEISTESRREAVRKAFYLTSIVDEALDQHRQTSRERGIELRGAIQPSIPLDLIGDPAPAREALQQLVGNAVTASPSGGTVEVVVSQDSSEPGTLIARFEVFDNGSGLSDGQRADLNAFFRGERADSAVAGAGLIGAVDRVSELAGEMGVEGVPGGGTLFWFTAHFDVDDEALAAHQWIRGLRTLVVQDERSADVAIQNALLSLGIIGFKAGDAASLEQALRSAEEYQNPYRLALVDLNTPDLPSVIPAVLGSGVPVVLVGTAQQRERISRAADQRIAGFLVRPVRQTELLELILKNVDPQPPRHGSGAPTQPLDF